MYGPGAQLGGRYRLDERIGVGGMGEVWRGTDEVLGRTVAVKVMLPALLDQPGFAERFRGEARTMANLNHPGVVDIYDYHSDSGIAFLVMEYIEGEALSRALARVGRLTAGRAMSLVAQAAEALQAAHDKGIVHRDVKPGNLLVRPDGTLVLTDFGIARSELVGQLTATGMLLGTAAYLSPEQAAGEAATAASDVYSLGVVGYQCLAGRRPFEGENPVEIAVRHLREVPPPLPDDIPSPAREVVAQAMAKEAAQRWASARQLADAARLAASATAAPEHAARVPVQVGPDGRAGGRRQGPAPATPASASPPPAHPVVAAPPANPSPGTVRGRPSWAFIAAVVFGVVAVLLCAGLVGFLARLAMGDGFDGATSPFMTTYAHDIEGSTTT